jgi:hypothetical protein
MVALPALPNWKFRLLLFVMVALGERGVRCSLVRLRESELAILRSLGRRPAVDVKAAGFCDSGPGISVGGVQPAASHIEA